MTATGTPAADLPGAVALVTRATGYALEGLSEVTAAHLDRPSPCPGWDVRALVLHLADSADGLTALAVTGELLVPSAPRPETSPVTVAEDRLLHLLGVLTSAVRGEGPAGGDGAGHAVTAARGAAIEVAVHGWDLATACGSGRPMPPGLASALLASASSLVDDGARPHVFAAAVDVPPDASAEDRLVAFLGRQPTARHLVSW
jgi:uncharacterized protein (TIGR03086 family)